MLVQVFPKNKSTRASCNEKRHSIPNGDPHCRDDRVGQAWLDWVSGGKRRSTCDGWNGEKQKFRPAFVSKECNGRLKNPNHDFCRSKKPSVAKEEQCRQYQQACQNRSSPGQYVDVQGMCSDAREDRKRPNSHNCAWLSTKFRQQVEPQSEHGRQCEQVTKAERASLAISLRSSCIFVLDVVRHGDIIVQTTRLDSLGWEPVVVRAQRPTLRRLRLRVTLPTG